LRHVEGQREPPRDLDRLVDIGRLGDLAADDRMRIVRWPGTVEFDTTFMPFLGKLLAVNSCLATLRHPDPPVCVARWGSGLRRA